MPQLDPTWFASQLFWLAITFAVLYFVLAKLALPPLLEVMERRQRTLEDDLGLAQGLKSQAEEARLTYERAMADARAKAQAQIADMQAQQKAAAEAEGKALDRQIEQKLTEATQRIAAKKQELFAAVTPTMADLTSLIVEKLMQRRPASEQVTRVLDQLSKGR